MILKEIKSYLKTHHHATISEIARHCDYEPSIVKNALDIWINKGYIIEENTDSACKACNSRCYKSSIKEEPLYSWKE
ncbi:MAG: FeoC-like transcriptional regulator [Spirochaetes bacterium]|jgi:hypothetical protein|nr:FeoC-like transcriptional regulator [Spirochaetota bacterium]